MTNMKAKEKAVLIVGAGKGGCQAALDLVESGYKVYLVDKHSSLDEAIMESEQIFPIKDCNTCILPQKFIDIEKNSNIELITNAEIISLDGKPGDFKATINKLKIGLSKEQKKIYVDCVQQCAVQIPDDLPFPQDTALKILVEERKIPPCEDGCPAHIKSQEYIDLISKRAYQESLNLIRERCPLPATIGRICPHPCEEVCNRAEIDEPINICALKRFVADYVRENIEEEIKFLEEKKKKKVAIVGSGPSGLTVAYHLARRGYPVTIFERESVAGGMLRIGVPNYRLPPDVLNADIEYIKKFGVDIKENTPIGPPGQTIKDLRKNFNAIFIGVGLQNSRKLNIEGEELENILFALNFLKKCSLGEDVTVGKKVLVIGGGDVAVDVARTALRKGAENVHMIMLESEDIIPAHPWEIEEAREEGIIFHTSRGPKRIITEDGKVSGIETLICTSVFDEDGRFNPVFEACSEEIVEGDMVIVSIGQSADLEFLDKEIRANSRIEVDPNNFQTSIEGVFAGGEIITGPGSAIQAIATGNKAAIVIEKYLKEEDISNIQETIPDYNKEDLARVDEIEKIDRIQKESRRENLIMAPEERKKNFKEFTSSMDEDVALEEAERCLSCGICTECFKHVNACVGVPISYEQSDETLRINIESVILSPGEAWLICYHLRKGMDYRWKILSPVALIEEEKCIGCGQCRETCIFEAINMVETFIEYKAIRDIFNTSFTSNRYKSRVNSEKCTGCGACITICPVGAISFKYFSTQQIPITITSYSRR